MTIRSLSTADQRRESVIAGAIAAFSSTGYLGTPISAVAERAGISTAYVFKLFASKEALFVAALDRCFDLIETALAEGAERASGGRPEDVLDAMGGAYAELIVDRELLMLQVHAQSAADVPQIRAALQRGLARVTRLVRARSLASDADVQRFIAWGQLCHLVVTTSLDEIAEEWAAILTAGIRHPGAPHEPR